VCDGLAKALRAFGVPGQVRCLADPQAAGPQPRRLARRSSSRLLQTRSVIEPPFSEDPDCQQPPSVLEPPTTSPTTCGNAGIQYRTEVGVDGVHPHGFRASFAHTWLAAGGQARARLGDPHPRDPALVDLNAVLQAALGNGHQLF